MVDVDALAKAPALNRSAQLEDVSDATDFGNKQYLRAFIDEYFHAELPHNNNEKKNSTEISSKII